MKTKLNSIATWTHLTLGLIIVAEISFIVLGMRFLMPACRRIVSFADTDIAGFYSIIPGSNSFLALLHMPAYNTISWLIAFAVLWGLFEWRVRNENKPKLRLAAMTSLSLLLFVVVAMFAAIMVIPTAKAAERLNARHPEPIVAERMAILDRLVGQLEQAVVKNDLPMADDFAHTAMGAANDLANTGAAASTLLLSPEPARVKTLRAELDTMASAMQEAWFAARTRHAEQIPAPLQKFCAAFAQVKNEIEQQHHEQQN
jgi:hypothetical protein